MCPTTEQEIVACALGPRPQALVAAVKAMTFAGIQVQAFWFDPEAGRGTGYFVTEDPPGAQAALRNAGLSTEIVAREVQWACHAPDDGNAQPPAA